MQEGAVVVFNGHAAVDENTGITKLGGFLPHQVGEPRGGRAFARNLHQLYSPIISARMTARVRFKLATAKKRKFRWKRHRQRYGASAWVAGHPGG